MRVKATVKIEILDGHEEGKTDTFTTIGKTDTTITEYGFIEHLRLEWTYLHNDHLLDKRR